MSSLRVFLVDDHAAICEGLRLLINTQPGLEVIGQASDGQTALQKISEYKPDLVVLDITMDGLNGAQVISRLKQICPEIRVLVLTRHSDTAYLRQMLEVGASGYVVKKAPPEELILAIRTIASGGTYIDQTLVEHVVSRYVSAQGPEAMPKNGRLTERETEVLRLIAWGYGNKEIASKLRVSVKTVEYYKTHSMEKLNYASRTEIVRYALQQGWLQET